MGGNNKEVCLIDTIKNCDINAAIKLITKNTSFKKCNKSKVSIATTSNKNKLLNGHSDQVEANNNSSNYIFLINILYKTKILSLFLDIF